MKYFTILFFITTLATVAFAQEYSFTDLGALPGGTLSRAYAINDHRQAVGFSDVFGRGSLPCLWQNNNITELRTYGADAAYAYGINNAGHIVGERSFSVSEATLWVDGVPSYLGRLGNRNSFAYGINELDQIVGYSDINFVDHAFVWQSGTMTDLGNGSNYSRAYDINNFGIVAGYSNFPDIVYVRACIWEDGQLINLGSFTRESQALALNDDRQVVGWSHFGTNNSHAFTWENGQMTDLGTLPGDLDSHALGINNHGDIVGNSFGVNTGSAVIWRNGVAVDLNTLIPAGTNLHLNQAFGINDRGEIVGIASTAPNFTSRAFLLKPVPETKTIWVIGLGLLVLVYKHTR